MMDRITRLVRIPTADQAQDSTGYVPPFRGAEFRLAGYLEELRRLRKGKTRRHVEARRREGGNGRALRLFQRHSGGALTVVYRMTGRRDLSEIFVEEAFFRTWRNASADTPDEALLLTTYRLLSEWCLAYGRSSNGNGSALRTSNPSPSDTDEGRLTDAVGRLRPEERLAFLLKRQPNMTVDRVAWCLGCSPVGAKALLRRAYRGLTRDLGDGELEGRHGDTQNVA